MAWTDHSVPSGGALVTEVLGALLGPGEVNLHFAVDDAGNLWEWNASQNWVSHGVPSAGIRVRAQVGAAWARGYMESPVFSSVFVIGTDALAVGRPRQTGGRSNHDDGVATRRLRG
jgi:hypothetical protein